MMTEQFKKIELGLAIIGIAACMIRIGYESGQTDGFREGLEAQVEEDTE